VLLELVEIMRQKDDIKFAEALNRLGNHDRIGLTKEDIALFDSRIVSKISLIPSIAIFIFIRRTDVATFNKKRIKAADGFLFWNKSKHTIIGNKHDKKLAEKEMKFIENLPIEKTGGLLFKIPLKEGCKYMITNNQNVKDGLANGTCGILKRIIYNEKKDQAVQLYIDFQEPDVGSIKRSLDTSKKKRQEYTNKGIVVEEAWTPVDLARCNLKIGKKTWTAVREQHELTASEALTVYKVQGATLPAVALDLRQPLQRSDLYVAMSRVTRIENLFLYGKRSIVEGLRYDRLSSKARRKKIELNFRTSAVQCELKRLRETATLKDKYPFLIEKTNETSMNNKKSISIIYHLVDGLTAKLPYIKADFGHMSADILILAQCHSNPRDESMMEASKINGYTLCNMTGSTKMNAKNGIALYIRDQFIENVGFSGDNSNRGLYSLNEVLEISMFYFNINGEPLYICFLNNNQQDINKFWLQFKQFINQYMEKDALKIKNRLFTLGTFNFDGLKVPLDKETKVIIRLIKEEFRLINIIEGSSTDEGKLMDWCLTNVNNKTLKYQAMHYESCFSTNKPIWLKIEEN
jgi:hypothetical protein